MFLFPSDPRYSKSKPDPSFLSDYRIAKQLDPSTMCFSETGDTVISTWIWFGWMLKPTEYQSVVDRVVGVPVFDTESYRKAHWFPKNYELIKEFTPKTIWFEGTNSDEYLEQLVYPELLRSFPSGSCLVKDFVKSAKEHWIESCFIPCIPDKENTLKVIKSFLKEKSLTELEGGLLFKQFVNVVSKETRMFFFKGKLLCKQHYSKEFLEKTQQIISQVERNLTDVFISVDVAETEEFNGQTIIETGYGGVSSCPEELKNDLFGEINNHAKL